MTANTRRPIALVTGASSGIGEELARCFARAQHDLVLVARSADKLQALGSQLEQQHQIRALALPIDLTEPEAAQRLAATLKRRRCLPDVLVNCAGVLEQKHFTQMKQSDHQTTR